MSVLQLSASAIERVNAARHVIDEIVAENRGRNRLSSNAALFLPYHIVDLL